MATRYWLGIATIVQQVSTIQITADDAATTYTVTINGISVSVAGAGSGVNDTAAALQAALDAAEHPYFSDITWTVSTDTVTGTGNANGAPFTATSSATGGTGTIGSVTEATAATSPNHFDNADNWSGNAVPTTNDTVIFASGAVPCLWALDQNGLSVDELHVWQAYTGFIGLNPHVFTTGPSSETASATEYRETHLRIAADLVSIGELRGNLRAIGSGRINIDNTDTGTPVLQVHNTAATAKDSGGLAVDYEPHDTAADIFVANAPGGVGIGVRDPASSCTCRDICMNTRNPASRLVVAAGVTWVDYDQQGGIGVVNAAADVTAVRLSGGTLTLEGEEWTAADVDIWGGTLIDNHYDSTAAITQIDVHPGGTVDWNQNLRARTISGLTLHPDGEARWSYHMSVTLTTAFNRPTALKAAKAGAG